MDVKKAAEDMMPLVLATKGIPDIHPEYGRDHLTWMCDRIYLGHITGERAHRWLGWIQGCVCIGGGANLEALKAINKAA